MRDSTQRGKDKGKLSDRLDEATSRETLHDLEDKKKTGEATKTFEEDLPAPDGEPVENREKRDDAGPM